MPFLTVYDLLWFILNTRGMLQDLDLLNFAVDYF